MSDPYSEDVTAQWGGALGPRASFGQRFGASLIDGLLVGLVSELLGLVLHQTVAAIAGLVISGAYYTAFEGGSRGAGFGKQALGIRVIDVDTGVPIGYPRAFVRWITHIISAVCLLIGYLWMLGDPNRQCWHDKFARDVVVPTAEYPVAGTS